MKKKVKIGIGVATVVAVGGATAATVLALSLPEDEPKKTNPHHDPSPLPNHLSGTPHTDTPATNPPATNPPVTNPPATNPPVTNPPATNPPATNPPATNPPATNPPATGIHVQVPQASGGAAAATREYAKWHHDAAPTYVEHSSKTFMDSIADSFDLSTHHENSGTGTLSVTELPALTPELAGKFKVVLTDMMGNGGFLTNLTGIKNGDVIRITLQPLTDIDVIKSGEYSSKNVTITGLTEITGAISTKNFFDNLPSTINISTSVLTIADIPNIPPGIKIVFKDPTLSSGPINDIHQLYNPVEKVDVIATTFSAGSRIKRGDPTHKVIAVKVSTSSTVHHSTSTTNNHDASFTSSTSTPHVDTLTSSHTSVSLQVTDLSSKYHLTSYVQGGSAQSITTSRPGFSNVIARGFDLSMLNPLAPIDKPVDFSSIVSLSDSLGSFKGKILDHFISIFRDYHLSVADGIYRSIADDSNPAKKVFAHFPTASEFREALQKADDNPNHIMKFKVTFVPRAESKATDPHDYTGIATLNCQYKISSSELSTAVADIKHIKDELATPPSSSGHDGFGFFAALSGGTGGSIMHVGPQTTITGITLPFISDLFDPSKYGRAEVFENSLKTGDVAIPHEAPGQITFEYDNKYFGGMKNDQSIYLVDKRAISNGKYSFDKLTDYFTSVDGHFVDYLIDGKPYASIRDIFTHNSNFSQLHDSIDVDTLKTTAIFVDENGIETFVVSFTEKDGTKGFMQFQKETSLLNAMTTGMYKNIILFDEFSPTSTKDSFLKITTTHDGVVNILDFKSIVDGI